MALASYIFTFISGAFFLVSACFLLQEYFFIRNIDPEGAPPYYLIWEALLRIVGVSMMVQPYFYWWAMGGYGVLLSVLLIRVLAHSKHFPRIMNLFMLLHLSMLLLGAWGFVVRNQASDAMVSRGIQAPNIVSIRAAR